jgi:hypothetical protein
LENSFAADAESFVIRLATEADAKHLPRIADLLDEGAISRGIGRGRRPDSLMLQKIRENRSIMAFNPEGDVVGFCYIDTWNNDSFVVHNALIVAPKYRDKNLGWLIKEFAFKITRSRWPDAKIFGLTTTQAVMHINSKLGYEPVVYAALPQDERFWNGHSNCIYYDVLQRSGGRFCLCTAMLYDPEKSPKSEK